ncbi:MAG: YigZ family protein [Oscillospiraceae bacterium]
MQNMSPYKTVKNVSFCEFFEKRSRFIGYISQCDTEKMAFKFIDEIRNKHKDANHNTWAFNLKDDLTRRYSDDKEPKGTAGIPILDIILKENLKDVCIVVTRYFGGTLLGTGGLIRAYSSSASLSIKSAEVIDVRVYVKCIVGMTYSLFDKIKNILNDFNLKIDYIEYLDKIKMGLIVEEGQVLKLSHKLIDVSNGLIILEEKEKVFTYI